MQQDSRVFLGALGLSVTLAACSTLPQPFRYSARLSTQTAFVAAEVSQIRGLQMRGEVSVSTKDKASLRRTFEKLIEEEWSEHDDGTERAYKLFGLLPEDMDLRSFLLDLYSGQIAGYYDPKQGEFFVIETAADGTEEKTSEVIKNFVIAHELVHALQDQHFDLESIQGEFKSENDRGLAAAAVMEGDATLTGFDHLLWQRVGWPATLSDPAGRGTVALLAGLGERLGMSGDTPEARQLREAPDVIRTELLFAYLQGMAFISAIQAEFGREGVDAVFQDLPDSSEQILHPERYLDRRDRPATIHLGEPPRHWEPVFSETLGMLTMQVLLREHLGRRAARAAKGWDGDRYVVWETPEGVALGWVTVWDRPHRARCFERTYRRLLERKLGDEGGFAIVRRDRVVVAVEGARAIELEAAAERLLESRIERPAEADPESWLVRSLLWPLSTRRLDRVRETSALGGNLFRLRHHERGHQFSFLRGLLGRSERNPDRRQLSTAAGLIWTSADSNHDYHSWGLIPLIDFHSRRVTTERHAEFGLVRLPFLGALFAVRRGTGFTSTELLRGLLLRIQWGPRVRRGGRVRLLMLPIPGL